MTRAWPVLPGKGSPSWRLGKESQGRAVHSEQPRERTAGAEPLAFSAEHLLPHPVGSAGIPPPPCTSYVALHSWLSLSERVFLFVKRDSSMCPSQGPVFE